VVNFTAWLIYTLESTPPPVKWRAEWAQESVWTFWRERKIPRLYRVLNPGSSSSVAKTGHGPQSSKLVVIYVVLLLFVLFYVLFVCTCVLYYCHRVTTQLQLTNIS